jgi:sn-glycerol 3-phosphate transport system substrate-binding protein
MKISIKLGAICAAMFSLQSAQAATEIQWWHAMGGALGERVAEIADN